MKASRLTSAAGSRISCLSIKPARVELAPFPVLFGSKVFILGNYQLKAKS